MLIITKADIKKVITMKDAIDAVKSGFSAFSSGKAVVPLRVPIKLNDNIVLFMPGALTQEKSVGVKAVSVCPGNIKKGLPLIYAAVLMLDGETGIPLALIEGGYITALRTGAAGGAAADVLARKDARVAMVFGAGVQGRSQLEALCAVRDIELAYVYDIDAEKARKYEAEMREKLGIDIKFVKDYDSVLPEADVVITATPSKEPFLKGKLLKEGAHVNAIGSHALDMKELDTEVFRRASVIAVDSKDAVLAEAGDLIDALNASVFKKEDMVELGEILLGKAEGRKSDSDITIFKTVGIAVEDVVVGKLIYERAREKGVGTEIRGFFD